VEHRTVKTPFQQAAYDDQCARGLKITLLPAFQFQKKRCHSTEELLKQYDLSFNTVKHDLGVSIQSLSTRSTSLRHNNFLGLGYSASNSDPHSHRAFHAHALFMLMHFVA